MYLKLSFPSFPNNLRIYWCHLKASIISIHIYHNTWSTGYLSFCTQVKSGPTLHIVLSQPPLLFMFCHCRHIWVICQLYCSYMDFSSILLIFFLFCPSFLFVFSVFLSVFLSHLRLLLSSFSSAHTLPAAFVVHVLMWPKHYQLVLNWLHSREIVRLLILAVCHSSYNLNSACVSILRCQTLHAMNIDVKSIFIH